MNKKVLFILILVVCTLMTAFSPALSTRELSSEDLAGMIFESWTHVSPDQIINLGKDVISGDCEGAIITLSGISAQAVTGHIISGAGVPVGILLGEVYNVEGEVSEGITELIEGAEVDEVLCSELYEIAEDPTTWVDPIGKLEEIEHEVVSALESELSEASEEYQREHEDGSEDGNGGTSGNQAPKALFEVRPKDPEQGQRIQLNASEALDPDGHITRYTWDFNGDGKTDAAGKKAYTRFRSSGRYRVTLTVRDNQGKVSSIAKNITVGRERTSFQFARPDSFSSNGRRSSRGWYWHSTLGSSSEWSWRRVNGFPREAYLNFHLKVSNKINGGSGFGATLVITILNRRDTIIERGSVDLVNTYRPRVPYDTGGVGKDAAGSYRIGNSSAIRKGFKVRIEWPPRDSKNVFATQRASVTLAYKE